MGEKRSTSDLDELQATKKAYREPSATSVAAEVVILNNNNDDGYEDSAIKGLLDMAAGGESDFRSGEPTDSNFSKTNFAQQTFQYGPPQYFPQFSYPNPWNQSPWNNAFLPQQSHQFSTYEGPEEPRKTKIKSVGSDDHKHVGSGLQTKVRPCAKIAKIENHAPSKTKANQGTGRELRFCFERGISGYQIFFPNPPEDAETVMKFVRYCKSRTPSQENFKRDDFVRLVDIFVRKEKNTRHSTTLLNVASFLHCYSGDIFKLADKYEININALITWLKDLKKLERGKKELVCATCRIEFIKTCDKRKLK